MAAILVKLKPIFEKPHTCVFQTTNTLTQRLVHPKDWTPNNKSNIVYAVQCSEECSELCTGESAQENQHQNQQHFFILKKKHTLLRTRRFTFWTEKINGLRDK